MPIKRNRTFWYVYPLAATILCIIGVIIHFFPPVVYADDTITIVIAASEDKDTTDVRIGQVQEWLEELGYYHGEHTMKLDANTQYALYSFCKENGLQYTNAGVTQDAWECLQSGDGKPAPESGEAPAYSDISFGEEGDDVLALQTRLKELGYFLGDNALKPSIFDEGTQRAVELFCEINNISYDGDGAPAPIQHIIFSAGAAAYAEPEIKLGLADRLTAYMTSQVSVLGFTLPTFFVWICSIVIVVLILVLAVYFFVPNREKTVVNENADTNAAPRYWRKTMSGATGAGLMAMEKLSASGNLLDFQVQYNGSVSNVQCVCKPTVTIGRGRGCNIVLNPGDTAASNSHCDLYYRGAVLMLRDHSSNGTYVNGRFIHKSECRLNSGDRITMGAHLLTVQF